MNEYVCPDCKYITNRFDCYQRHLNKKIKCTVGNYQCECGLRTGNKSNLNRHKKLCKGRAVPRSGFSVLEAKLQKKVTDLETEVEDLKRRLIIDDLEDEDAGEKEEPDDTRTNDVKDQRSSSSKNILTNITGFVHLKTIDKIDAKRQQVYFFECGPLLKPCIDIQGTLVKFGSTDVPYDRLSTHIRDHGGGRLLDSILTNNPT